MGLFLGLSLELTLKLGHSMNAALRFVSGTKKFEQIMPIYSKLQILLVTKRQEDFRFRGNR